MSVLKLAMIFADKQAWHSEPEDDAHLIFTTPKAEIERLPFARMILGTSPRLLEQAERSAIGLYLVSEHTMLNQPLSDLSSEQLPGSVGIFPMIALPAMSSAAAHDHWRNVHAPLALEEHKAMTHYYQLHIAHKFFGPEMHGIALCCFATEQDLRERMYTSEAGKRRIAEDIVKFADTRRSPRKVVAEVLWSK